MEIVECSDDVFLDAALIGFPVERHLLSVCEHLFCSVGGCSRLLAFTVDFDDALKDVLFHVNSDPAFLHPGVEEEDCHCFVFGNFCVSFVAYL